MNYYIITLFLVSLPLLRPNVTEAFIPSKLIDKLIDEAEENQKIILGEASETIVHEMIIKRGLLRSVAKYFYKIASDRIDLSKLETGEYYHTHKLFADFFNHRPYCSFELKYIIHKEFQPEIDSVDLNPETKDLPWAHFDAGTFRESNERVIHFFHLIHEHIENREYKSARRLLAQILHTIQDFYSHSNWIEMGNNDINRDIGTQEFVERHPIAEDSEVTCNDNCQLVTNECNLLIELIYNLMQKIGYNSATIRCPVKYYKCDNNVVLLNKLVSGFYEGQKLKDGTPIKKPANTQKCSHGGLVDGDSFSMSSYGGINKDSGHYLFSPRADLHLIAADLAVKHTEFVFDQIRDKYGDNVFAEMLKLNTPIGDFNMCMSLAIRTESGIMALVHGFFFSFFYF